MFSRYGAVKKFFLNTTEIAQKAWLSTCSLISKNPNSCSSLSVIPLKGGVDTKLHSRAVPVNAPCLLFCYIHADIHPCPAHIHRTQNFKSVMLFHCRDLFQSVHALSEATNDPMWSSRRHRWERANMREALRKKFCSNRLYFSVRLGRKFLL